MKKIILVIFLAIGLLLTGCESNNSNNELWNSIENTEFGAANYMGEAIYFYEEDSIKYCDFWMSGSGVPAIFFHTSEITFDEDGNIVMDVPSMFIGEGNLFDDQSLEKITVNYDEGAIYLNSIKYEDFGFNSRDSVLDWIND